MNVIIYNKDGIPVSSFNINDDFDYLNGRVSKGNKAYYKGVGVPYSWHFVKKVPKDNFKLLKDNGVFYSGIKIVDYNFIDKTGIFQTRYQSFYPDFIGTCGVKEGLIVVNSISFEKTGVEVLDYIEFDSENKQGYYVLDYINGRIPYINKGKPKELTELLRYMLNSNWNFLWDKGSIKDVYVNGTVGDVADLFISNELKHKIGTVYSIFYSLYKLSPIQYNEFIKYNNLKYNDIIGIVLNVIQFLEQSEIYIENISQNDNIKYINVLRNYIVTGKNCGHCACDMFQDFGDEVMKEYKKQVG